MADEKTFLQGLVGGLIVLAILVVLFGGSTWAYSSGRSYGSTGWFSPSADLPELVAAGYATSAPVGVMMTERVDEIGLGSFSVYGSPAQKVFPGGEIFNGLLFGEQSLKYTVNDLESVFFKIDNTNGYGALVIKINGEVAFADLLNAGENNFALRSKGPTTVEITTDSSYWRMWAPALYQISEVKLRSSENAETYEFDGSDVLRGELVADIEETNDAGDLVVAVNGQMIFGGRPQGALSAPFTNVHAGKNKVTIMAAPGASYTGSAVLRLVRAERAEHVAELAFNLTKEQAAKLPGHITFEIPTVVRPGLVSVKIIVGDQVKLAESFEAEPGAQAVAMFSANVVPNQIHKVVIEGAEGGAFTIRNLKVRV